MIHYSLIKLYNYNSKVYIQAITWCIYNILGSLYCKFMPNNWGYSNSAKVVICKVGKWKVKDTNVPFAANINAGIMNVCEI